MNEKILIPTNNLYTTLLCIGIVVFILTFVPNNHFHGLMIQYIQLSGKIEELKAKQGWLSVDRKSYEEGVAYLDKYKQWEMKPVLALNPGTQESKMYEEMTGQAVDPNIAMLILSLNSKKEIDETKEDRIIEIQSRLDKANKELVDTRRVLEEINTELNTKEEELLQKAKFIRYEWILGMLGKMISIGFIVFGGYNWYTKTQKYEDLLLKKSTEGEKVVKSMKSAKRSGKNRDKVIL